MEIAVFAAAVADDAPAVVAPGKIKKSGDSLTLELIKTKDILGSARSVFRYQGTLVGFAEETENLGTNARSKRYPTTSTLRQIVDCGWKIIEHHGKGTGHLSCGHLYHVSFRIFLGLAAVVQMTALLPVWF
jgi:hypothetical protein